MGRVAKTHSSLQSFEDICKQAFGLGLHPWEFYEYTIYEYRLFQIGRAESRKQYLREEFQHIRILAYHVISPYLSKKDQKIPLAELIPDIYESEKAGKKKSLKESANETIERYKKAGYLKDVSRDRDKDRG